MTRAAECFVRSTELIIWSNSNFWLSLDLFKTLYRNQSSLRFFKIKKMTFNQSIQIEGFNHISNNEVSPNVSFINKSYHSLPFSHVQSIHSKFIHISDKCFSFLLIFHIQFSNSHVFQFQMQRGWRILWGFSFRVGTQVFNWLGVVSRLHVNIYSFAGDFHEFVLEQAKFRGIIRLLILDGLKSDHVNI